MLLLSIANSKPHIKNSRIELPTEQPFKETQLSSPVK
jgi:hypothetical protein